MVKSRQALVKPFLEFRDGGSAWKRQRQSRGEVEAGERGQQDVHVGRSHLGRLKKGSVE